MSEIYSFLARHARYTYLFQLNFDHSGEEGPGERSAFMQTGEWRNAFYFTLHSIVRKVYIFLDFHIHGLK